jgi:hypothetical protein
MARHLFGPDEDDEPDDEPGEKPDPSKGNHVPREGTSPATYPNDDRQFARELFTGNPFS